MTKQDQVIAAMGSWPICRRHNKSYEPSKLRCAYCAFWRGVCHCSIYLFLGSLATLLLVGLSTILPDVWGWYDQLGWRGKIAAVSVVGMVVGFLVSFNLDHYHD